MQTITLSIDDGRDVLHINEDAIVSIAYKGGHKTLSVASKLVITTTRNTYEYVGSLADTFYDQLLKHGHDS